MSRSRVIFRNIFSNWMGFAVQAGVVFFLTPFVLHHLGDTRYGIWVLVTSITGYYGLLAFGFQGGINQYLTRYLATGHYEKMNMAASTAVVALTYVGLLVVAIGLILAWLAPYVFNIPPDMEAEVFWCIIIIASSVAIQFILFPFSAIFVATQRYDLSNFISVMTRLLSAGLIYSALHFRYGLIGISIATAASNILDYFARWRIAYRILPQLEVTRHLANMKRFREMLSYGVWSFLISISNSILMYLDALVIGALMPIAALAPYALAAALIHYMEAFLRPIDRVFFPVATELHAREDMDTLRAVYLRGSRFYLVIVGIVTVIAGFWAEDFFRLWIGEKYISNQEYPSVALLFQIQLITMVGMLFPGLGGQVLLGSLRVKSFAIVVFLEAVSNVLLSIVLIRFYGLVGVALGTLASVLMFRTFTIPILVGRQLDVPLWIYARQAFLKPLMMVLMFSLTVVWIRSLGEPSGFGELIVQGVIATVAALPLALFIGLTQDDRKRFVYSPILATWSKLVRSDVKQSHSTLENLPDVKYNED